MSKLKINFAASEYDHFRDLADGTVVPSGIALNWLKMPVEEAFTRFVNFLEWELSEMSMGKYVSFVSTGNDSVLALPVFPSRVFRQSSIFVRRDGPVRKPEDLRGKKVGIPEWAQTAAIYTRGWLQHQVGIPLAEIDWYQAGINQAGREEKVELKLPPGVRYTQVKTKSLSQMLLAGELDAVAAARPPQPFVAGSKDIVRLFPDYRQVEESFYKETGIFPIMHVIAMRRDVYEANRWIAVNLYNAFVEAKRRAVERALDFTATSYPFAWCTHAAIQTRELFGEDFFPYGLEANRKTLDAFLQYAFEQGVCHRRVTPDELFPKELTKTYRV
jgi:4,5-dihydroxyphthalate decarboxylase